MSFRWHDRETVRYAADCDEVESNLALIVKAQITDMASRDPAIVCHMTEHGVRFDGCSSTIDSISPRWDYYDEDEPVVVNFYDRNHNSEPECVVINAPGDWVQVPIVLQELLDNDPMYLHRRAELKLKAAQARMHRLAAALSLYLPPGLRVPLDAKYDEEQLAAWTDRQLELITLDVALRPEAEETIAALKQHFTASE